MSLNLKTLTDVYPAWMTSGIFADLQNLDVPWKDPNISTSLDVAYYGKNSGDKIISPLVEKILGEEETLTDEQRETIAKSIFAVCGQNWQKLWATLNQEYNLLDNTDAYVSHTETTAQTTDSTGTATNTGSVTRKITGSDTDTNTGTDTHAITGTDTTKDTGTLKTDGTTGTDSSKNTGIYGFNSTDASNADTETGKDTTTATQTETHDLSNAVSHNTTDTETINTTHELTHNTTDSETRDLSTGTTGKSNLNGTVTYEEHRHGNIGVTTSQQMLSQERDLWQWYFYDYVFSDLDRFLTIKVY